MEIVSMWGFHWDCAMQSLLGKQQKKLGFERHAVFYLLLYSMETAVFSVVYEVTLFGCCEEDF